MHKYSDDNWHPYIALGDQTIVDSCEFGGFTSCTVGAEGWTANDPDPESYEGSYRDLSGISTNAFVVGLRCRANVTHTCGNGFSIQSAEAAIYSAFFTISDPTPPALGTPTGAGWTTTDWAQGTLPLALSSTDNTGIAATRVYADGALLATLARSCAYTQPRPCMDEPTGAVGLPTAGLADGTHAIELAAVNAAGTETRVARPTVLKVDNRAPAAPVALASPAATATATNAFAATWALPADAGTPIVRARWQLCSTQGCTTPQDAPSLTGVSGIALPTVGTYDLRVWLVDALGHEDPAAGDTLALSYQPLACRCPIAPPDTTPLPDPQPPLPPPTTPRPTKASPNLRLTTIRRSGRRVTVAGRVAATASGRVAIRYRVRHRGRTRTVTGRATIRRGTFRVTLTLPPAIARSRTATITAVYAGDNDTAAQSRTATLRS